MEVDAASESAVPGPSHTLCLNVLIVALNETCDGKSWYTSTKQLQLASLEFCIACRNVQTMHLKVDAQIPRRLLVAVNASPPPEHLCLTRVPRLRARRVTWNMPTAVELRNPIFAMTDVDCLEFGGAFEGSLEAVAWPRRLKTIEFNPSSPFNKPIELVEWPASLEKLVLGTRFNQPIEEVVWPSSLKQLIFHRWDSCFNQPIRHVAWPTSLQLLAFGDAFNQPIEQATLPASLQQLTFLGSFNQPIQGVGWSDWLQRLELGYDFNQSIDNVKWPASLQELTFGWCSDLEDGRMRMHSDFNQRIGNSVWPASLRRLTLGDKFRQSLQGLGTWMPNLEAILLLHYGSDGLGFLRGIEWPKGLRQLTVFNESSVDGVEIPSTVEVLIIFADLTNFDCAASSSVFNKMG